LSVGSAWDVRRIGAYLLFGVLTTAVNVAVYGALTKLVGFGYMWANGVAGVASVAFAYVTNRRWVFESRCVGAREVALEAAAFFMSRILTGLLDAALMLALVGFAHAQDLYAKVFVNVVVVVTNYVLSRRFVFRR
jgi:putative flippase GtrA